VCRRIVSSGRCLANEVHDIGRLSVDVEQESLNKRLHLLATCGPNGFCLLSVMGQDTRDVRTYTPRTQGTNGFQWLRRCACDTNLVLGALCRLDKRSPSANVE